MAFCEKLERHKEWQQRHLPTTDTRPGMELFIWLGKNNGKERPIGQLYKECGSSEPTLRGCVKDFVRNGLAVVTGTDEDTRKRLLYGTPKLQQVVQEYRQRITQLGEDD